MMAEEKKQPEPKADFYLFLDGVTGSVKDAGHEGWIKLGFLQFGVGLGISRGGWRRRNQTAEEKEAEKKKKEEEEAAALERGETEEEAWERRLKSTVEVSIPSLSEVTFTKEMDSSSSSLFHQVVLRKPFRRVIIERVMREDKSVVRFELDSVFISGFSMSNKGQSMSESLSLNYQKIEFCTKKGDHANAVSYDIGDNSISFNGQPSAPFFDKKDNDD